MNSKNLRWSFLVLAVLGSVAATAQTAPTPAPAAEPVQPPAPAASAPVDPKTQRIEITGGRASDTDQRRQSTAAKIVIGREEIERFGDTNLLDLMKRLPGVTVPGAPGRGGGPRMRGMGGNYTQLLIDGERVAPGFSLDSIPPEQIERIEILRAPTAETGARAIAGTINIVLREGFKKRLNDLRLGMQVEQGNEGTNTSPGLNWIRNDTIGPFIYNLSLSAFQFEQDNAGRSRTVETDRGNGTVVLERNSSFASEGRRRGINATGRLQWRNEQGMSLMLQPVLIDSRNRSRSQGLLDEPVGGSQEFASSDTQSRSHFRLARFSANFNHRAGQQGPRLEWRMALAESRVNEQEDRLEFNDDQRLTRTIDEDRSNRSRTASLSLKAVASLDGGHSLVGGAEIERSTLEENKITLWDGDRQLIDFDANLGSATRRVAVYAQDEWSITPQWAVHAGVRSEQIATEGEGANAEVVRNTSRVTTPLLHAVYKFDAKGNDQVRASLTRSYRSPNVGQLIGRPNINRLDPTPGPNEETTADSAGNPNLQPEIAAGLDIAIERYLAEGGVLSANIFYRRINDVIRSVVAREDVSWSPGVPRFVSRPQNIGNATTQGLELEAKFRMDQWVADAPRTDVRLNLSLYRSRIDSIPGPDNRITEQPGGTLNIGFDHRFRGTPWAIGSSWNHTPGYRTQLEADRAIVVNEKNAVDAYATYTFNPNALLRLSLANALGDDATTQTQILSTATQTDVRSSSRSYRSVRLGLELKL